MRQAYGQIYADLYRRHWWWRAREAILLREIGQLGLGAGGEVLDVGCGNGLFLERLATWGSVTGIEIDRRLMTDDAAFRERIHHQPLGDPLYQAMRFDLITALDVIEHIEDDGMAVRQMVDLLHPGGYLVVTVPAFMCLWDEHDEINEHCRRYRVGDLRRLLAPLGRLVQLRYLFPSLFPVKLSVAWLNRLRSRKVAQAAIPGSAVTAVMVRWLAAEDRIAGRLRPPIGTSVLGILQKPRAR